MNIDRFNSMFGRLLLVSLIVAWSLAWSLSAQAKRVALVIGNGSYNAIPALENPLRDAELIAGKLRAVGFDVDLATDGDYLTLMQKVRAFGHRAQGADAALFYFAGHGLQADGSNYLLPVDARLGRISDLAYETLPLSLVMNELEFADAKINLVVLDACRDNPLTRSLSRKSGTRTVHVEQGLASVQRASGTFIAYATAPGEVAYDGSGTQNSPFSRALADWIEKPDLEIALMFRRVREQVVAATKGKQVPWVEEAILGDFYFQPRGDSAPLLAAPTAAPAATPAVTTPAANAPAANVPANVAHQQGGQQPLSSSRPRDDLIADAWSTTRALGTREAYEAFLKRYPDSIFTDHAMTLLSQLSVPVQTAPAASSAPSQAPATRSERRVEPTIKIIQGNDSIPNLY